MALDTNARSAMQKSFLPWTEVSLGRYVAEDESESPIKTPEAGKYASRLPEAYVLTEC